MTKLNSFSQRTVTGLFCSNWKSLLYK